MKKQDTAAFSLIRCDTEKKMPALAVRAIRAALFFAGLLAVAQGAAGIWTNYGWLWAAAGAAALVWQSVALGLPRRWLRAVLPLLCLICAAAFSRRFLAGAITVSSSAGETLTKATGHILLPLAGVGADAALFVAISAALLGTLCAYAVRWSPTVCGLLLTVLSAALLALLRPDSAQVWMAACPLCAAFAAGRRRGRPQRIRSNAFELWRAAGSGRRACSCTAGRTGPAKRHIVFRVGNGFPHRIAPAPVRIRAGCAAGRGVFQLFRRTGADIMPDRHDGAADGALSARLYRRYLHRHGMAGA